MASFEQIGTQDPAVCELRFPSEVVDGSRLEADSKAWTRERAVVQLGGALRGCDAMAPSEIFDICCDAVAAALELATAVVIEGCDGLPRSISWKRVKVDFSELSSAERCAWSIFADRLSLAPCDSPSVEARALSSEGYFEWVVALAPPLTGILLCGTYRPLDGPDRALLRYMAARLSFALYRYDLQWEGP